ncbi:hypothetical protein BH11ACT6_BH11ACT6_53190 [soil metagenome]
MVYVDFDGLRSGANTSYTAADRAYDAAGRLARVGMATSMFGDFDEAKAFQQALSDAQQRHAQIADKNCTSLGSIGDNANRARAGFIDMEERHTATLDDVY